MNNNGSVFRLSNAVLFPLLVALILRTLWTLLIPVIPVSDSVAYDIFAWNIAEGYGYGWVPHEPTAFWPVGTSAIYGAIFWLFGHNYLPVVALQIVVGVAIVAISMALAKRWFDERVAILTGWVLALWPLLIQYTTILASETYFILFVLLAFWFGGLKGASQKHFLTSVLAGIALAAASYVRPLALIMAPLLYVNVLFARKELRSAIVSCVITIIVMGFCILPWAIRNWQIFEQLVPISTNGGSNLWMGNNPSGSIEYMPLPKVDIANEADRDKYFGNLAKQYIFEDPAGFVLRTVKKIASLYDRETIAVTWNERGIKQRFSSVAVPALKLLSSIWWWGMLVLAAIGVMRAAKLNGMSVLVLSPFITWIYFTLLHSVYVAGDRYHVPSVPFIAMFAAGALSSIYKSRTSPMLNS